MAESIQESVGAKQPPARNLAAISRREEDKKTIFEGMETRSPSNLQGVIPRKAGGVGLGAHKNK